jgi:magnesium-transporting ATPase (P-type)
MKDYIKLEDIPEDEELEIDDGDEKSFTYFFISCGISFLIVYVINTIYFIDYSNNPENYEYPNLFFWWVIFWGFIVGTLFCFFPAHIGSRGSPFETNVGFMLTIFVTLFPLILADLIRPNPK